MTSNLHSIDRFIRFFLAAFCVFAAIVIFSNPFARVMLIAFAIFALWEGLSAKCPLMLHLGVRSPKEKIKPEQLYLLGLVGVQVLLAHQWLMAGLEKISDPNFTSGMGVTISYFASKNPFVWYTTFLRGFVAENAATFGYLVEWSQVVVAVTLFISAIMIVYTKQSILLRTFFGATIVVLLAGAFMNANFYLAAGWTSPGTHGINVLMFWSQLLLVYMWLMSLQKRV